MTSELIRITYVKSAIGYSRRQKDTIRTLGLRRLGDSVIQTNSASLRGMTRAVGHLVRVEPAAEPEVTAEKSKPGRRGS